MTDFRRTNQNKIVHDDSWCRVCLPKYSFNLELSSSRQIPKYIIPSKGLGSHAGLLPEVRIQAGTSFVTDAAEVWYRAGVPRAG